MEDKNVNWSEESKRINNDTKLCKHCQTEIPKKAKVCPNCRKKQKGGFLKWIVIVIVAIIAVSCVAGGDDSDSESEKDPGTSTETIKKSTESDDETGEDKGDVPEEDAEESNELTVGSSFEKNGLTITVDDASIDFKDYEDEYGYNAPNDGMKYVMCAFTFENKGDSDAYVSIYDFDCYADNTLCDQIYSLDDNDFMNTNLSSGRNVSFKTYYAVPVNANSIELEYETNAWTSEKVIIKLK